MSHLPNEASKATIRDLVLRYIHDSRALLDVFLYLDKERRQVACAIFTSRKSRDAALMFLSGSAFIVEAYRPGLHKDLTLSAMARVSTLSSFLRLESRRLPSLKIFFLAFFDAFFHSQWRWSSKSISNDNVDSRYNPHHNVYLSSRYSPISHPKTKSSPFASAVLSFSPTQRTSRAFEGFSPNS